MSVRISDNEGHSRNISIADLVEKLQHNHEAYVKKQHDREISVEVFLSLVISIQVLVCVFNAKYPDKFREVTFFFLALYPLTIFYHADHLSLVAYFFVFLWLCWGSVSGHLMYKAMGPPFSRKRWVLKKDTPQTVYKWFLKTHSVCYSTAGISLIFFFFLPGQSLLVLFISLYFGVLGRDCADLCTNRISSTIGYLNYEVPPDKVCALCDEELVPTLELMLGDKTMEDNDIKENPTVTLDCGHVFHKVCILGWTMVGKKDTCPFCREKVEFGQFLKEKAWNSPRLETWWVSCLVVMRFLLVWNPIASYAALYFLKIFHFEPLIDSHGKPLY